MHVSLRTTLRLALFVFGVSVLVCLPFLLLGETYATRLFDALRERTVWLVLAAVVLLSLDAVLPVPSAWVVVFLAQQAGVAVGILGGAVGLIAGVPVAIWVGRTALGRAAPWFIPESELVRLRDAMQRHAGLTLACMRSVPVLAETSVMVAAAVGVPARRIFFATLPPNLAIAVVYALAGNDSLLTALIAFLATVTLSYGAWRLLEARRKAA